MAPNFVKLGRKLESKFKGSLGDVWPNLKLEPYDRASLGTLKEGCMRLNIFKENSVVGHLISTILQLRVPMSHEKEGIKSPPHIAILTVELIEAFVRYCGSVSDSSIGAELETN